MAGRKTKGRALVGQPGDYHFLDGLASIPVNPVTLASSGVLRATFDAISDDPDVARSGEAARGRDQDVIHAHAGAVARLAQRTAEHYASTLKETG